MEVQYLRIVIQLSFPHGIVAGNVAVTFQPGVLSEKGAFHLILSNCTDAIRPDWGPEDLETFRPDADIEDPVVFYEACHSVGEKKFWKIAEEYPQVDFTSSMSLSYSSTSRARVKPRSFSTAFHGLRSLHSRLPRRC